MALNFRKSDVKKAIEGSGGYVTNIAKKLGCDWHSAKRYINLHGLQELLDNENETWNDVTEMKLMENISNNDTTAIIFRLKTRAKDRGYVEQQKMEVSGALGTDVNLQIEVITTPYEIATDDTLTLEEQQELKMLEGEG